MENLFLEIGLALTLYVSTDIDDIFVLLAFFADPRFRTREVVLGQFLGIFTLVIGSMALALAARQVPPAYIGLLGLVPLGLGVKKLWELLSGAEEEDPEEEIEEGWFRHSGRVLAVAGVTVANGGDNLGVYIPLFAAKPPATLALYLGVFFAMTGLWCALAVALVRHARAGALVKRFSRYLVPWVFIGLGVYILVEAGSFGYFLG